MNIINIIIQIYILYSNDHTYNHLSSVSSILTLDARGRPALGRGLVELGYRVEGCNVDDELVVVG
jgi:hypothetical protein